MAQRLVAERLSARLYRLFSPNSPFPTLRPKRDADRYIPESVPPVFELPGLKFKPPANQQIHMPRVCPLPRMREVYGDWQLAQSL